MPPLKKVSKIDFLAGFYQHVDKGVWSEGIDIYQSGKVLAVGNFQNLVSCRVEAAPGTFVEVRLKLHPSGKVIQWMECTCKKNRSHSYFCEHIAAFLLHIDQEQGDFFRHLDSKMPFSAPGQIKTKAANKTAKKIKKDTNNNAPTITASSPSLLDHLHGSIIDASLNEKTGRIKLRIEIKAGKSNVYELSIDDSAQFLAKNQDNEVWTKTSQALHCQKEEAELATFISVDPLQEKITCEKVVVIKLRNRSKILHSADWETRIHKLRRVAKAESKTTKSRPANCLVLNLKTYVKYLGANHFYLPGFGYFPLTNTPTSTEWQELALSRVFRNDEAAKLAMTNFAFFLAISPVFLDEIADSCFLRETLVLKKIKVIREQENFFHLAPYYQSSTLEVPMAELVACAKNGRRRFYRSGQAWIKIPDFVLYHNWVLDEGDTLIRVDRLGLIRLRACLGDFDQFVGSTKLLETLRSKIDYEGNIEPPPLSLSNLKLRSYQNQGFKWFWWLYCNELHGLLADEMGLGKTHQAMALLTAIQQHLADKGLQTKEHRFLVICPTTVLNHWHDKISEFAPNLKALVYHGSRRSQSLSQLDTPYETLVTSYGVLLRDIKKLEETNWQAIILDEAHFVKNNNTATYRAACRLNSRIRICLTGTPMENHLGELKNLFDFLAPGFLGSDEYFKRHFITPIENDQDRQKEQLLQKLIYPLKLRRRKADVLDDLPNKTEDIRHCELSEEQRRLYQQVLAQKANSMVSNLQNETKPIQYLHVFAILQLLKQICNHPALLTKGATHHDGYSGKFELLKELIAEALDSGNKIVIFSQYVNMLAFIKAYCDEQGIGAVVLSGKTRDRGKVIESFQNNPNIKIFIGSLLAGGLGIDLTAASVVIHYDRWWNPSKENQATDRVHRIGQKKYVQVFKLVTKSSLEEKIDQLIRKKQDSFSKFLEEDADLFAKLSRHELIELLQ